MIIKPQTSREKKNLFIETLLNTTDKISKVGPDSVLDGIAGGVAKVAGKAEKDIILAVSQLFPDTAYGEQLDQVAANFGLAPRMTQLGSSTYIRLVGLPGTFYNKTLITISSNQGINFELEQDITLPVSGYTYAKIKSIQQGSKTNSPALTINKLTPAPSGHQYIINEVGAVGGRDQESDDLLRIRIKDGSNILARGTISMLEQKFMSINPKVLKIFYQGITGVGKVRLAIATQTGEDLNPTEITQLLEAGADYFCLTEYRPFGVSTYYGVELVNIEYQPIDISFRIDLASSADPDTIRKNIQIKISKYLDFRFFDASRHRVEWDNLLQIVKDTEGVEYVPDQYFYPRVDIGVSTNRLPRLRGFLMLDLLGSIIQDLSGNLNPVFYPNTPDFSYQATVLNQ